MSVELRACNSGQFALSSVLSVFVFDKVSIITPLGKFDFGLLFLQNAHAKKVTSL